MRSECALSKDTATRTSLQDASRYASGSNYFLFSPLEKLLAFADSRETSLISRDETRLCLRHCLRHCLNLGNSIFRVKAGHGQRKEIVSRFSVEPQVYTERRKNVRVSLTNVSTLNSNRMLSISFYLQSFPWLRTRTKKLYHCILCTGLTINK